MDVYESGRLIPHNHPEPFILTPRATFPEPIIFGG